MGDLLYRVFSHIPFTEYWFEKEIFIDLEEGNFLELSDSSKAILHKADEQAKLNDPDQKPVIENGVPTYRYRLSVDDCPEISEVINEVRLIQESAKLLARPASPEVLETAKRLLAESATRKD